MATRRVPKHGIVHTLVAGRATTPRAAAAADTRTRIIVLGAVIKKNDTSFIFLYDY